MINDITESRVYQKLFGFKQLPTVPNLEKFTNPSYLWHLVKKAINKSRRLAYRISLVSRVADSLYAAKVARYKKSLSELSEQDRAIVETLEKDGTVVIPIEELQFSSTEPFLQKTLELGEELRSSFSKEKFHVDVEPHKLKECPEIFLWGVEQRLLGIMEHCIGLPVYYQGYAIRRDIVNRSSSSNTLRNWHRDVEDRAVIKIIIYLHDVGLDGGCYEYISKDLSEKAAKTLKYNVGYLSDQKMSKVISEENWNKRTGKLGTVIISKTSDVFHRAKPPEKEDRVSISFCYTSKKPKFYWDSQKFLPKNISEILDGLSQQQRDSLENCNKVFGIKLGMYR